MGFDDVYHQLYYPGLLTFSLYSHFGPICKQGTVKHYQAKRMLKEGIFQYFLQKIVAAFSVITSRILLTGTKLYGAIPTIYFRD